MGENGSLGTAVAALVRSGSLGSDVTMVFYKNSTFFFKKTPSFTGQVASFGYPCVRSSGFSYYTYTFLFVSDQTRTRLWGACARNMVLLFLVVVDGDAI